MLRLRSSILAHLLSPPSTSPISHHHRLISAAVSPTPGFNVVEYLVGTCGLTREQALKASPRLSHLKSPVNPNSVLTFLAGLGLSSADIAAAVAKEPTLLCAGVETTLDPNVAGLTTLGLSRSEIARLAVLQPRKFRLRSIVSKLCYYLPIFGSAESFLWKLKRSSCLLTSDLEKVVKPNVAFLRAKCGLSARDITKLCVTTTWVLTINPERLPVIVACAEGLGVPRDSAMFGHVLHAVAFLSEEEIAEQVENLKSMFGWSDAEVRTAISKLPSVLTRSSDILQKRSEFLISEVGLEPAYIAHRPALLSYSLERRLMPRYYVVKFLKANGLLGRDRDYYSAVKVTEKVFLQKYICPHNEVAPHLVEDYAASCRGEVPPRFIFS